MAPAVKNCHENLLHGFSAMKERKKGWDQFVQRLQADVEGSLKKKSSKTICGTLPEYFDHIETQAAQVLKESDRILFKRNESRFLKDGKFLEWSEKFFKVCQKLTQYMTFEEVKAHNRKIIEQNLPQIQRKITKARSDLRQKLILRKEKGKELDEKGLTLEIRKEWERLLKIMPVEDLVVYSLDVLKKHKLKQIQKRQTAVIAKEKKNGESRHQKHTFTTN